MVTKALDVSDILAEGIDSPYWGLISSSPHTEMFCWAGGVPSPPAVRGSGRGTSCKPLASAVRSDRVTPVSFEGSAGTAYNFICPISSLEASVLGIVRLGLKLRKKMKEKQLDVNQSTRQNFFSQKGDHEAYLVSPGGVDALPLRVAVCGALGG